MVTVSVEHKDDLGSFKYKLPVSVFKDLMSEELLRELKKFLLRGPIREDHIEDKKKLGILLDARLVCGFYFRSHNCCYGLTNLGHAVLNTLK